MFNTAGLRGFSRSVLPEAAYVRNNVKSADQSVRCWKIWT